MGTTLTALLWGGNRLALAHIGDSRAYLLRDGELVQITHDHTLVQHLVDEGQLDEAEIPTHPQRSVVHLGPAAVMAASPWQIGHTGSANGNPCAHWNSSQAAE